MRGHEEALRDGGRTGVISEANIRSAIGRPYHGYHRLIHQKAAALVEGIIRNHGFADANKRTSLYLVELLIERSGYRLMAPDDEVVETIVCVANGEIGYGDLNIWFKEWIVRVV